MMLSAYICCRNCIELDYPVIEAAKSLIPVAQEVVICDSDSDDGTAEILRELAWSDSRVRIINRPWTNPIRDINWLTDWINWTRERLRYPMQIQLDADEVLGEESYHEVIRAAELGEARWFFRANLWGDAQHMAPSGYCCGDAVVRMGPTKLWMPSDEPHPEGDPEIRQIAKVHPSLKIYHYGFLRKTSAFYKKSRVVQNAFFGQVDKRVTDLEEKGVENWAEHCPFEKPLVLFNGRHPEVIRPWLAERGYKYE